MLIEFNEKLRRSIMNETRKAEQYQLSPYFKTLSSHRFSQEYDTGKGWIIGPFEHIPELTYEKSIQWNDPLNVGWKCNSIHNCSLLPVDDKLFMFYRANPSMESLSSRIGIAVYQEGKGWHDYEGNPVIYPTLDNEDISCDDPKIYKVDDKYVLFYQACFNISEEDRLKYCNTDFPLNNLGVDINVAVSYDLFHWEKKGSIIPRDITKLWAKAAVIPKEPDGTAARINGKYIMYISEGCGGKQVVGTSYDMLNWEYRYEQFLDTSELGTLYEVACSVTNFEENDNIVLDFFYGDDSGVCRAGQALYNKSNPTKQLDINKGGTLSWGGIIKYNNRLMYAQGWDAPYNKPIMYFYACK